MNMRFPASSINHLGSLSGRLGRESIIGKTFVESDSAFGIIIKGITPEEIKVFLSKGAKRKQLEAILAVCMPNHLQYTVKFDVSKRKTLIGRDKQAGYSGDTRHIFNNLDKEVCGV